MRILASVLVIGCVVGCANTGWRENQPFEQHDSDFAMIAVAAVASIERYGAVTHFAVPPSLDRRALAALKRIRPLVPVGELPTGHALPAGYFLIEEFSIDPDGSAMFAGDLGPTGCAAGCGKNISIPYVLRGDDWFNPSVKVVDYSVRREVIPVNGR